MTATSDRSASATSLPPTRERRAFGVFNLIAGTTLAFALVFQIVEKVVNDDMIADQYFSYFTILTTMITIVVVVVGGVMALRRPADTDLYTTIRLAVVSYAVVTAIVYNLLLRGIPDEGYVVTPWPGEIMHVWMPGFLVLDWLFAPGRPRLRWSALGIVVIYPLAWAAFTLVRGAFTGWVPYPFFEFSTGFVSIALYILGIAAIIIGFASLGILWSRVGARSRVADATR